MSSVSAMSYMDLMTIYNCKSSSTRRTQKTRRSRRSSKTQPTQLKKKRTSSYVSSRLKKTTRSRAKTFLQTSCTGDIGNCQCLKCKTKNESMLMVDNVHTDACKCNNCTYLEPERADPDWEYAYRYYDYSNIFGY